MSNNRRTIPASFIFGHFVENEESKIEDELPTVIWRLFYPSAQLSKRKYDLSLLLNDHYEIYWT